MSLLDFPRFQEDETSTVFTVITGQITEIRYFMQNNDHKMLVVVADPANLNNIFYNGVFEPTNDLQVGQHVTVQIKLTADKSQPLG